MWVGANEKGETGQMSRSVVQTLNERVGGSVGTIADGGEAVERVPSPGNVKIQAEKEGNGPVKEWTGTELGLND